MNVEGPRKVPRAPASAPRDGAAAGSWLSSPSFRAAPFLPCYTRFSLPLPLPPLGAPGGDRRATAKAGGGPPRDARLSWGRTDLHANPGWEPGTAAGSGHPGWGAGFAELFLTSPQLGSRPSARAHGRQGVRVAGPQPPALRFRLPRSAPGRRSGRRARHSLGPLSSPRPASRCFPRRRPPLHLFTPLNQSPLNAADPSVLCTTLGSLIAVTRLSRRPRGQCWAVFTPAPLPSASLAHRAPRRPKAYLPPRILPGSGGCACTPRSPQLADSLLRSRLALAKGMAVYPSDPARDLGRVQDARGPSPPSR